MKNTFIALLFIFWGFVVAVVSAGYITKQNRLREEAAQKTYTESINAITAKVANQKTVTSSNSVSLTTVSKATVKSATKEVVTKTTSATSATTANTSTSKQTTGITMADVELHSTTSDCWIVINGNVYSVASYIPMHPGGARRIANLCGGDATSGYEGQGHSSYADSLLGSFLVGKLN